MLEVSSCPSSPSFLIPWGHMLSLLLLLIGNGLLWGTILPLLIWLCRNGSLPLAVADFVGYIRCVFGVNQELVEASPRVGIFDKGWEKL